MSEVTYYVALPFIGTDDGIAAGEPTECFNPVAVVMAPKRCNAKKVMLARLRSAALVIRRPAISRLISREGEARARY